LIEEVEIATNVKLNLLYIANLKDELESLQWTTRIIRSVLDRAVDGQRHLGVNRTQLELDLTYWKMLSVYRWYSGIGNSSISSLV
jgi:hypothetical protein